MLSLPMFAIMPHSVRRGFVGLSRPKNAGGGYEGVGHSNTLLPSSIIRHRPYTMLALNLLSQLICVAGVNQLSSVCTFFIFPRPYVSKKELKKKKPPKYKRSISSESLAHSTYFPPPPLSPFVPKNGLITHYFFPLFTSDRECPLCRHRSYSRRARQ